MLGGHVPLETGETTRDELYLSGLEGERHRHTQRDAERERGGRTELELKSDTNRTFSSRRLLYATVF